MKAKLVIVCLVSFLGACSQNETTERSGKSASQPSPRPLALVEVAADELDESDESRPSFQQLIKDPRSASNLCFISSYSVEKSKPPHLVAFLDFDTKTLIYPVGDKTVIEYIPIQRENAFSSSHELYLFASQRKPFEKIADFYTRISTRKIKSESFLRQVFGEFKSSPTVNAQVKNFWNWVYLVKGAKCSALAHWPAANVLLLFNELHQKTGSGLP